MKQTPPARTASTVGPCPSIILINRPHSLTTPKLKTYLSTACGEDLNVDNFVNTMNHKYHFTIHDRPIIGRTCMKQNCSKDLRIHLYNVPSFFSNGYNFPVTFLLTARAF